MYIYLQNNVKIMKMKKSLYFWRFMPKNCNFVMQLIILSFVIGYLTFSIITMSDSDHVVSAAWTQGSEMPTPRVEPSAGTVGSNIYVIGGADYSKSLIGIRFDKVEIYDTQKDKWITSTRPMPVAADHTAAAAYENKIYVIGGFTEGRVPTNKLFIYDTIKDEWTEGKPMSTPRAAAAAQFLDGILYVVGGSNQSYIPLNSMEAYDPQTDSWTSKAPMLTARHHLEMAAANGKLFALGGRLLGDGIPSKNIEPTLSNFNRNEMYDPETDKWTVKQPLLVKLGVFGSASAKGQIYIFGGEDTNGGYLDSVEIYNTVTDKWTYGPSMPTKRIGLEAVTVGNKIYTIGGQIYDPPSSETGLIPLDSNEILNLNNMHTEK